MAKKKKNSPFLGVSIFLVAAFLLSAGIFAALYIDQRDKLEESDEKLSDAQSKHEDLLVDVSRLRSQLDSAEEKGKLLEAASKEIEGKAISLLAEKCDSENCLLPSAKNRVFGLATVKAYYRKVDRSGASHPAIVIVEGERVLIDELMGEDGPWIERVNGVEDPIVIFSYGSLSDADKNKIRSAAEDDPVVMKIFSQESIDGAGSDLFSPWAVLSVE